MITKNDNKNNIQNSKTQTDSVLSDIVWQAPLHVTTYFDNIRKVFFDRKYFLISVQTRFVIK